jgi:RNA polymerase sigma-70 factor, ECF subfamily
LHGEILSWFEECHKPLLRYVLSFGLSVHDAEEVAQEVFLALFRHFRLQRSRENVRGWLFRVAHNLALKRRQANQKCPVASAPDRMVVEARPDPELNPEELLAFKQQQQRLLAVLCALPQDDQCCLRLRAEGLRYREIAAVLGISLGSVSTSLTRSLARLSRAEGSGSC